MMISKPRIQPVSLSGFQPYWENRYRQEMAKRGIPIRTTPEQRQRFTDTLIEHTAAAVIQPSAYVRAQAIRRAWLCIGAVPVIAALAIWGFTV